MSKDSPKKVPGRFMRTLKTGGLTGSVSSSYLGGKLFDRFRSKEGRKAASTKRHLKNARKIVETMGELRGPMMKIGQLLSTHAEAVPNAYVDVLGELQSNAPPMPYSQIREQIYNELGQWPEDAFLEFEEEAMAAASIGQVHRAVIEATDEKTGETRRQKVAVKVQYPGADDMIESDLKNMSSAVKLVKGVASDIMGQSKLDFTPVYEEISEHLRQETDYCREAYNAQLMAQTLRDVKDVIIPKVFNSHSSLRVITYEFIDGQTLSEFLASDPPEDERQTINELIARSFWNQIFGQGIMHADPHPGNYLVTNDCKLALLDFGCVKIFSEDWLQHFNALMRAHITHNEQAERDAIIALGLADPKDPKAVEDILMIGHYFASGLMEDAPVNFSTYNYSGKAKSLVEHFLESRRIPRSQRDMIFLTRVSLGLYDYFARLNVPVNYHRIAWPFVETPWSGRRIEIPEYYMDPSA